MCRTRAVDPASVCAGGRGAVPVPAERRVADHGRVLRPHDPRCEVVPFRSLLSDTDFRVLAGFLSQYPEVSLRAYGSYDGSRDLDFLQHFRDLRDFRADALYHSLADIEDRGAGYLRETSPPGAGPDQASPFAGPSRPFPRSAGLYLEAGTKDIHVVSNLVDIRRLTLRSITLPDSDSVDLEESEPTHRTTSRDSGVRVRSVPLVLLAWRSSPLEPHTGRSNSEAAASA
jgi:hypothetical protein